MKRPLLVGLLASATAALAGGVASAVLGSRPDGVGADGPLPPCGPALNCYRSRRAVSVPPQTALATAEAVLRGASHPLSGRVVSVEGTADGLRAVFQIGPFRDDVQVAAEARGETGSMLYLRSASRSGNADMGLNRRRGERLLADIAARIEAETDDSEGA